MWQGLQGWHFIVIIAVVVLLFGAPKLPGLAKSLGQSLRVFRGEMKQMKDESADAKKADETNSDSSNKS
jgi:sec-independent protein translocase protein TatA